MHFYWCLEPMKQGDCWNYVVKWYYYKDANSCGQFWYGGCNGTNNRFETEKECRETCVDWWISKLSPSSPPSITSFQAFVLFYLISFPFQFIAYAVTITRSFCNFLQSFLFFTTLLMVLNYFRRTQYCHQLQLCDLPIYSLL